jgi:hypothetical protein
MSKIPMITTGGHRYEGRWLRAGDTFEALNQTDADELRVLGFAILDKDKVRYQTRHLEAEAVDAPVTAAQVQPDSVAPSMQPPADEAAPVAKPMTKRYRRRDMAAAR